MFTHCSTRIVIVLCMTILTVMVSRPAQAGVIRIGEKVEHKPPITVLVPVTVFVDSSGIISQGPVPIPPGTIVPNKETIFVPVDIPQPDNVYPLVMEVPQQPDGSCLCGQLIDFFDLLAAEDSTGIGPLPAGTVLQAASFFGATTGRNYPAVITRLSRIFPLTKLLDEVLVSLETVGFIQEGAHDIHHTTTVYQGVYRPT